MEEKKFKRALRNPRTSANRINEIYELYWDVVDAKYYAFDIDDEILKMFLNHPNCPEWIKDEINSFLCDDDDFEEDDDYLDSEESASLDDDEIDYRFGEDEENIHFEPTKGWISDN